MNFDLISTAFAQGSEPAQKAPAPMWPMFLLIFVVFYFFLIRPQQKKQKDTQNMLNSLARGDRVITIGGIHGTIVSIKKQGEKETGDDIVVLRVSESTKLDMLRSSIARVISREGEATKEKAEKAGKE
ncbi:MAG: preprotein translocase subunit YajC [Candidatus Latescibacterota bacterium]